MASHIWLGALKPSQNNAIKGGWLYPQIIEDGKATRELLQDVCGDSGGAACIAKGNIIEGIEAKE